MQVVASGAKIGLRFGLALLSLWLMTFGASVLAVECNQIFPDGASNHNNNGRITIGWNSQIQGSPDGILATKRIYDYSSPGSSCVSGGCVTSDIVSASSSFSSFPGGANVNLGNSQTRTLAPGNYGSANLGNQSVLTLGNGTYTFSGTFTMQWGARLNVQAGQNAVVYVNGAIDLGSAWVNEPASGGYILLYSRTNIDVGSSGRVNAVLYAEQNLTTQSGSVITGAVSAGGYLTLNSGSTVRFDSTYANRDFGAFCTAVAIPPPAPIGLWRLDEVTWTGAANEIVDSSGNNLHGRAINLDGLPATQLTNPAIAGNPGTCRSGNFNGTADGYGQIDDPGTNSILDVPEFTLAFWFLPRSYPASGLQALISKDTQSEVSLTSAGTLEWWWGGGDQSLTSTGTVSLGVWHHLAITYRSGQQLIYLDGALFASHNSTQIRAYNNLPIFIGTDYNYHSRRFNGKIDEIQYFGSVLTGSQVVSVMNQTHVCPAEATVFSYGIDVPPAASTCSNASILITVRNSANQTLTNFTGTITLSTSRGKGDWSKTATASDAYGILTPGAADSGSATYQFAANGSDLGTVRLNLTNVHKEAITITVAGSSVTSVSSTISFSDNVFEMDSVDSLADDLIAGRPHQYRLRMMKKDAVTGVCGPASGYNVNQIKAWLTPAAGDPGGVRPTLINASQSQSLVLPVSQPAAVNFSAAFSNGIALVSLTAPDVGAYAINLRDDSNSFADQSIVGASNTLVARPFALDIQVPTNPAASSGAGGVFKVAGTGFSVSVRAVLWQAADDVINNDGIADGHNDSLPGNNANLSDNPVAARFGQEFPAEAIRLSANFVAPAAGVAGVLASTTSPADGTLLSAFTNGVATTSTVMYSEVGIIELKAALNDSAYLSASPAATAKIVGRSGYVGRFTPSHFVMPSSAVNPFCNSGLGFSYLSQYFGVNVTVDAKNSLGNTTQNYRDDFIKFGPSLGSVVMGAVNNGVTNLSGRVNLSTITSVWANGSGVLTIPVAINRVAAPDGPFPLVNLGVALNDGDNIRFLPSALNMDTDLNSSLDSITVGQTYLKFGRLFLSDAYGPETAKLPVTLQTQFWDGSDWAVNVDDNCSTLALTSIRYPGGPLSVAANRTVVVGAGSTEGRYGLENPTSIGFIDGDAQQYFTAPGAGNTGSLTVDVDLSSKPWLWFDWNQDGNYANDTALPASHFTFGVYRGHDRVLYWREVLE